MFIDIVEFRKKHVFHHLIILSFKMLLFLWWNISLAITTNARPTIRMDVCNDGQMDGWLDERMDEQPENISPASKADA